MGSTVFKAMLGRHFKKGESFESVSLALEISLPEDDGSAMLVMCTCVHELPTVDSQKVPTLALYKACDKYDLVKALAPTACTLLDDEIAQTPREGHLGHLNKMLGAAIGFKFHRIASKVGRELIRRSTQPLCNPFDFDINVPEDIYGKICNHDSLQSRMTC